MICPKCGKETLAGNSFCPHCGQPLAQPQLAPAAPMTPAAPARPPDSPMAIVSLILGIAGFFMGFPAGIAGIILGVIARKEIDKSQGRLGGREYATGGIITGAVSVAIFFLVFIFVFIFIGAAIAIPGYFQYQARAKQAEAKQNLEAIYNAEQGYFAAHQQYAQTFSELNWSPSGPTKYSYFLSPDQEIPATVGGPFKIPENLQALVEANQFEILAIGNIDSDPMLDVWGINQNHDLVNLSKDAAFENSDKKD